MELNIHDFALIRHVSVRFSKALNILTGETGAGKSIILDAMQILLGSRAKQIKIRTRAKSARIEGLFRLENNSGEILSILADAGLECEDREIVIRRELFRDEPSRSTVNGYLVSAGMLRKIGELLVDFHGQQETSTLRESSDQLDLLDTYGGTQEQVVRVRVLYQARKKLHSEKIEVEIQLEELRGRVPELEEDIRAINSVNLTEGEEANLEGQKELFENFEEISALSGIIFDTLSDEDGGIVSRLSGLRSSFEALSDHAKELTDAQKYFDEALYSLEEVSRRLGRFVQDFEHDPQQLEVVRIRLAEIARVKRKYGKTVDEVVKYRGWADSCLERNKNLEGKKTELEEALGQICRELDVEAKNLSSKREVATHKLEADTERVMKGLGLGKGKFRIEMTRREMGKTGLDRVRFMVSLNPGEPLLPLAQVASGGELSRIMLAVKTTIADKDRISTLIFDEIDAGIGGEVGITVGEKLSEIARSHQVLVVTHLPQIAVRADEHLLVEKVDRNGGVDIELVTLEWENRTDEVARMLGGDPSSSISREHAKEMLGWAEGIVEDN